MFDPLKHSHSVSRNFVGVVHSKIFGIERPRTALEGTGIEDASGRDGVFDGRARPAVRVGMEVRNWVKACRGVSDHETVDVMAFRTACKIRRKQVRRHKVMSGR